MDTERLEITEYDEAGNLTSTYVQSRRTEGAKHGRVDILVGQRHAHRRPRPSTDSRLQLPESGKTAWQRVLDVFLPAGYPQSVTEDYIECVKCRA